MADDVSCPCGSDLGYEACCGLWHAGAPAPTAEALMRSRYAAFVRRDLAYLLRTSHPRLRAKLRMDDLQRTAGLGWCGLTIVATSGGGDADREGMVHFRASYAGGVHEERSRFIRGPEGWLYRDALG